MSLWKLRLTMYSTLALIIGATTLVLLLLLRASGLALGLGPLIAIVAAFNLVQWLIAPYVIEGVYRVREADPVRYGWLHEIVSELSERSGIKKPKVMIADVPIPNAFAYGSPLTGSRVAVTTGLLSTLSRDEVEAVLGHELGHLAHRDVAVMMAVSLLPAVLYYVGYALLYAPSRRDEEGGGAAALGLLMLLASFVLNFFVLGLSRLREYYADRHSAMIVERGARKLQLALAKIVDATSRLAARGLSMSRYSSFKALLIADPTRAVSDAHYVSGHMRGYALVERLKRRRLTLLDQVEELFSTHPNIVKRLRALDEVAAELGQA
ncbi:MAG: protease [Thermoprotei archaeon]|nr:MAG: protease [Thermoprotei archaeon]